jgi:hypothetical protein
LLLSGIVEDVNALGLIGRLEEPVRGIGMLQVSVWAAQAFVTFQARLYGDHAPAAHYEAAWQAWIDEHFPAPQVIAQAASE